MGFLKKLVKKIPSDLTKNFLLKNGQKSSFLKDLINLLF
jgi:hypothetical protein